MNITNIKFFKAKQKGPVLAYANVVLDNHFIIRGITLLDTEKKGKFISMPSRKLKNGDNSYRDICHPLNSEVRSKLTEAVFTAYDEFIASEE